MYIPLNKMITPAKAEKVFLAHSRTDVDRTEAEAHWNYTRTH